MTIKEFFTDFKIEVAQYVLSLDCPQVIFYKDKIMDVKKDVGEFTYGQWIAATELIQKQNEDFNLIRGLVLIFHWNEIMIDKPFDLDRYDKHLDLINDCEIKSFYLVAKSYKEIIEKQITVEHNLLNFIPKADQMQAGIDRFNKYGFFGTLYNLGLKFGVKPTSILSWEYNEVLLIQQYQKDEGEFLEAYNNIVSNKK